MNQIVKHKDSIRLTASIIALVTLLAYTFWHTGGLLSHYIAPGWIGYVAAFGIEVSIVSLSLRIGELKRTGLSVNWFFTVLVAVVIVSAIANTSEGHLTLTGEQLTWASVQRLDIVQGFIGIVATALISLIVFSLSEIVGDDVNETIKVLEKERKAQEKKVSSTENLNTGSEQIEQARTAKAEQDELTKQQRLDIILDTLTNQPDIALTSLAELVDISRTTLYTYLRELEQKGLIEKNGQGIKVNGREVSGV